MRINKQINVFRNINVYVCLPSKHHYRWNKIEWRYVELWTTHNDWWSPVFFLTVIGACGCVASKADIFLMCHTPLNTPRGFSWVRKCLGPVRWLSACQCTYQTSLLTEFDTQSLCKGGRRELTPQTRPCTHYGTHTPIINTIKICSCSWGDTGGECQELYPAHSWATVVAEGAKG